MVRIPFRVSSFCGRVCRDIRQISLTPTQSWGFECCDRRAGNTEKNWARSRKQGNMARKNANKNGVESSAPLEFQALRASRPARRTILADGARPRPQPPDRLLAVATQSVAAVRFHAERGNEGQRGAKRLEAACTVSGSKAPIYLV